MFGLHKVLSSIGYRTACAPVRKTALLNRAGYMLDPWKQSPPNLASRGERRNSETRGSSKLKGTCSRVGLSDGAQTYHAQSLGLTLPPAGRKKMQETFYRIPRSQ